MKARTLGQDNEEDEFEIPKWAEILLELRDNVKKQSETTSPEGCERNENE